MEELIKEWDKYCAEIEKNWEESIEWSKEENKEEKQSALQRRF